MTVISIDKDLERIHFLAKDSLRHVAKLLKDFATKIEVYDDTASYWQLVFLQSKANGCSYRGENLPHLKWQWPRDTWFQEQLNHHLKALELAAHHEKN